MTTATAGRWAGLLDGATRAPQAEEGEVRTDPPQERVTPPLLMGDILMSRRGVPVFVEDWLRLERERDERRRARQDRE